MTARDFEFGPDEIKASNGETLNLTLSNQGATPHTFTVYRDQDYTQPLSGADTGLVDAGGTKQISFTVPADSGDLYFRCTVHPTQMQGEIKIED